MHGGIYLTSAGAYELAAKVFQPRRNTNILGPASTVSPQTEENVKLCVAKTLLFLSDRYRETGQISQSDLFYVFLQALSD